MEPWRNYSAIILFIRHSKHTEDGITEEDLTGGPNIQLQFRCKLGIFPENVPICQGKFGSRRKSAAEK